MLYIHARKGLLAAVGVVALGVALALGGFAAPASAHDSVLGTVPADTEHVDTAPATVSMQFTDDIMQLGAIMLVVDAADTDWGVGEPTLDGPTATLVVDPALPDGAYQVRWRVVSADGHPISGTFDFSVGDAGASPPAGAVTTDAAAPVITSPSGTASVTTTTESTSAGGLPIGFTAFLGAVVGVGLFLGILALGRRRRASASSSTAQPITGDIHSSEQDNS